MKFFICYECSRLAWSLFEAQTCLIGIKETKYFRILVMGAEPFTSGPLICGQSVMWLKVTSVWWHVNWAVEAVQLLVDACAFHKHHSWHQQTFLLAGRRERQQIKIYWHGDHGGLCRSQLRQLHSPLGWGRVCRAVPWRREASCPQCFVNLGVTQSTLEPTEDERRNKGLKINLLSY